MNRLNSLLLLLALAVPAGASAFTPTPTPTPVMIGGMARTPHTFAVDLAQTGDGPDDWDQVKLAQENPELVGAVRVDLRVVNESSFSEVTVDDHGGARLHFKGGTRFWQDVGDHPIFNHRGGASTLYVTWWT